MGSSIGTSMNKIAKNLIKKILPDSMVKILKYVQSLYFEIKRHKLINRLKRKTFNTVQLWIKSGEPIRIDIGAGPSPRRHGWHTLDRDMNSDLYWDLVDGMPFPDNTVTAIYASHVLEHIPIEALNTLLRECLRALKPSGSISICVPDAGPYFNAYADNRYIIDSKSPDCWQRGWYETGSYIDQINYIAYMNGEHKFMFDRSNLPALLKQAGFVGVTLREADPALDLPNRVEGSIYAVAFKGQSK